MRAARAIDPAVKRDHYPMLDLLRGLAALLVLLFHVAQVTGRTALASQGYLAVDFFFMLSGFVMGAAYEPAFRGGLTVAGFVRLRLIRLYPVAMLGVLVGLACALVSGRGRGVGGIDLAMQLLLLPLPWAPRLFPLNNPLWTLFFELVANLLHGTLLRRIGRRAIVGIAVAGAALLLVAIHRHRSMQIGWAPDAIDGAIGRLLWGYGVGLIAWRLKARGRLAAWRWPNGLLCGLFVALLVVPSPFGALRGFMTDILILPPLLVLAINARLPGRWLTFAAGAGAASYPLYAIHAPVLEVLKQPFATLPAVATPVAWLAAAMALIGAAVAIDRLYDRPLRRALLGRFAPDRRTDHAIAAADREKRPGDA